MIRLPNKEIVRDKFKRGILCKPELFIEAYVSGDLIKKPKYKRSIEKKVGEFISSLQWDLRSSYNSSSCLNRKQRDFLERSLYELLTERS